MKNIKQKIQLLLASLFLLLSALLYTLPAYAAGSATMYLSPASGSHNVGDTFSVGVWEDSGSDDINGVQANLSYPANLLTYVSSTVSSTFNIVGENSGGSGSVAIGVAKTAPPVHGAQQVATVNFKVTNSGSATISFASGSAVVKPNGGGSLALTTVPGSYNLVAPAPPAQPPPSSPPPASSGSTGGSTSSKPSSSAAKPSGTSSSTSPAPSTSAPSPAAPSETSTTSVATGAANKTKTQVTAAAKKSGFSFREDWPWVLAGLALLGALVAFVIRPFGRPYTQPTASSKLSLPPLETTPTSPSQPAATSPLDGFRHIFGGVLKPGAHASLVVYLVVFAGIGGYITWRIFAASPNPPTVYLNPLNPSTPSIALNSTFTIQVRENSGTTAVNAVQANFSYPVNLVDFVSIDTTGTAFDIEAQSTGGNGQVSMARGKTTTSVTGDQLVATVTFKSKTSGGSVPMAFTSGTALVSYGTNADILGSLSNTGGVTYTIDTTAPTTAITAPANGASIGLGTTTTISATASDTGGTISKVEILVDGAVKTSLTTSPYNYSWNTTGLTIGNHTVQARATDSAGNAGTSNTVTVAITDKTAPTAPSNLHATSITKTGVNLAWSAATDNVGVVNYRVTRGSTTLTTTPNLAYSDSGLSAGTNYNYSVVSIDAAGNVSAPATLSVTTPTTKAGDITGDGKVDIFDLSRLADSYGKNSTSWAPTDAVCDLNKNGAVDIFDLSILADNYGS